MDAGSAPLAQGPAELVEELLLLLADEVVGGEEVFEAVVAVDEPAMVELVMVAVLDEAGEVVVAVLLLPEELTLEELTELVALTEEDTEVVATDVVETTPVVVDGPEPFEILKMESTLPLALGLFCVDFK